MSSQTNNSEVQAEVKTQANDRATGNQDQAISNENLGFLASLGVTAETMKGVKSDQVREQTEQSAVPLKEISVNQTSATNVPTPEIKTAAIRTLPAAADTERPTTKGATLSSDNPVARSPVADSVAKTTGVVAPVADVPLKVATSTTVPAETTKLNLFPSPTGFDSSVKTNSGNSKVEGVAPASQNREVGQRSDKSVDVKPFERSVTNPVADQVAPLRLPTKADAHDSPLPTSLTAQPIRETVGTDLRAKSDAAPISTPPNGSKIELPSQRVANVDAVPGKDSPQPRSITSPASESKLDTRPLETKPSNSSTSDVASPRDTKAAGVANEVFGAKPSDRTDPNGAKSDLVNSISNKVDQAVPGKSLTGDAHPDGVKADGVRNDATRTDGVKTDGSRSDGGALGGKQSTTNDASNPIGKQNATEAGGAAGKPPTVGDAASTGGRQTSTEAGGRAPGSGGGGGGASDGASATHKNDSVAASGNKAEGNAGTGSSGSSGPTDRSPHKPFGVEDAQGTKVNSVDGKATAAGTSSGPRFDTGETKISTPGSGPSGAGSVGGGAGTGRFDVPDLKPGSGAAVGAGAGASGGSSHFDSTQIPGQKGLDVTGGKTTPEGILNQTGKSPTGRVGEGVKIGDDNPIVLPGMIAGRDGRRQSDQVFGDRANPPVGGAKTLNEDTVIKGPKDNTGKASDAIGIPSISGPADMGGALRNFAQSVLSTDKGDQSAGKAPGAGKDSVKSQSFEEGPKTFAGPGQKTTVLGDTFVTGKDSHVVKASADNTESTDGGRRIAASGGVSGDVVKGAGASGMLGSKKDEFGFGEGGDVEPEGENIPIEEFALPAVDFLSESDEAAEVEESVDEADEGEEFDERTYELALGLQLYNAVAEAQYGAYHYFTREGDTVELVSRDVVGDPRTAPLVFSLNKDHILASTEYGVHPFKVGVMIQLPTPREIKMYFGPQSK